MQAKQQVGRAKAQQDTADKTAALKNLNVQLQAEINKRTALNMKIAVLNQQLMQKNLSAEMAKKIRDQIDAIEKTELPQVNMAIKRIQDGIGVTNNLLDTGNRLQHLTEAQQ